MLVHYRNMRRAAYLIALCTVSSLAQVPNLPPTDREVNSSALPATPPGASSALGGRIADLDRVRDQFVLKAPGKKNFRILFDSRTQIFEDGKKISILDLHPTEHASIETRLDGTDIFAVRIHILKSLPEGNVRGQVVTFQPTTGILEVRLTGSENQLAIAVPSGTPVARIGEQAFVQQSRGSGDLIPGSLVGVSFKPSNEDRGTATKIDIIAVPGAEVGFRGVVVSLDLDAGRLSIQGEQDSLPSSMTFDPSRLGSNLRVGTNVKGTARFDGERYTATSVITE